MRDMGWGWRLWVGLLCAWLSLGAAAEGARVMRIGTSEFPPFEYMGPAGLVVGADTEIIAAVVRGMGFEPRFEMMPWARVEAEAAVGRLDMLYSLTASPERLEKYWLTAPLSSVNDVFFKQVDAPIQWQTYDDLKAYEIGVSAGYSYAADFMAWMQQDKVRIAPTAHETPELINLRKLALKRIDLFICEQSVCGFILRQQRARYPELAKIDFIPQPVGPVRGFRAGFSKAQPGSRLLRDRFNDVLGRMVASGERKAILERYGMTREPLPDVVLDEPIP